jgi:hypothetical protein
VCSPELEISLPVFPFFTHQPYHKESDTDREYDGQAQRAGEGGGERFVECLFHPTRHNTVVDRIALANLSDIDFRGNDRPLLQSHDFIEILCESSGSYESSAPSTAARRASLDL